MKKGSAELLSYIINSNPVLSENLDLPVQGQSIAPIGKIAIGVIGIKLNDGDKVIAALPIHKETDTVAVFASSGLGKKTSLSEFPIQARGGKGTYVYKPTDNTGDLVGAAMLSDEDNVLIVGNYSTICISAKDISLIGKVGMGNILIKNNRVLSVTKI